MTIVTKAALAAELGISRPRVSQYVQRGMPVRADGKLDREVAVQWVADNHLTVRPNDKGATRARKIAKEKPGRPARRAPRRPETEPQTSDVMLLNAVAEMVAKAGPVAAAMAIELGLPCRIAFALDEMIAVELATVAENFLIARGFDHYNRGYTILEEIPRAAMEVDWSALAAKAGEPLDEDAWGAFVDALPWSKALEPAPC
jgi:hypothetical protein